jgi:hypothetical protein
VRNADVIPGEQTLPRGVSDIHKREVGLAVGGAERIPPPSFDKLRMVTVRLRSLSLSKVEGSKVEP